MLATGRKRYPRRMRFQGFSRAFFAFWLAIAALTVNAVAQRELGFAVIAATAEDAGFHIMPDGSRMAGSMGHAHDSTGGHTHKGHADCDLCGLVADMAAFTPASVTLLPQPPEVYAGYSQPAPQARHFAAPSPPYASRAPPAAMI